MGSNYVLAPSTRRPSSTTQKIFIFNCHSGYSCALSPTSAMAQTSFARRESKVSLTYAATMSVPFVTAPLVQIFLLFSSSKSVVQRLATHSTSGAFSRSMGSKLKGAVARLPARIPEKAAGRIPEQMTRIAFVSGEVACFWMKEIVCAEGT